MNSLCHFVTHSQLYKEHTFNTKSNFVVFTINIERQTNIQKYYGYYTRHFFLSLERNHELMSENENTNYHLNLLLP